MIERVAIWQFVRELAAALARGDGYVMGAYGQNPRTGYLDLSVTDVKAAWQPGGWYYAQYADRAKYSAAQQAQALKWREQCVRVWDCNGLAEGIYQLHTGANINSKARYNYADWCPLKGAGMIPAAYRVPGAAVFWGKSAGSIEHVAYLYEPVEPGVSGGDWYLIEARGVMAGVIRTRLSERAPKYWGWMSSYYDYGDSERDSLGRGDKGADVKAMQAALLALGYDLGRWGADGDFGKKTEQAVKAFQRDRALPETGLFGPAEAEALEAPTGAAPTSTVTLRGLTEVDVALLREKWPKAEAVMERG